MMSSIDDQLVCSIPNQLKFMEGLEGETREKGVAVIQARGDQRVDQDGGAVGVREGWRRLMLRRWKYADRVTLLMWVWNDRVPSRTTPRLLT